jgi:integrase/recombinase XerD
MEEPMSFKEYLQNQRHTRQTVKSYCYQVDVFLTAYPDAQSYSYKNIVSVLSEQSKLYKNLNYRNAILAAIKRYYDYLVEIGKRNDHPCRGLFLKSGRKKKQVIHNDLFSSDELELLMKREERYADLKLKNRVLVSLLIYQGLTAGEVAELNTSNIDLDNGTVYLKGTPKLSRRHLELTPNQLELMEDYLANGRPRLERTGINTDKLILSKLGTPITVDDINYIIGTFKSLYPERNLNSKTIRQSVISNWLNERKMPLEQVQLMAGHRWISSTLPYRQVCVEEQREIINRFHPLG